MWAAFRKEEKTTRFAFSINIFAGVYIFLQETLEDMMVRSGFCHVDHEVLVGGVVAIHSGFKPRPTSTPSQEDSHD